MDKKELRSKIRQLKQQMTPQQIEAASKRLTELFLNTEEYKQAKAIYGYLPYNQEIRTVPLLEQALRDGKKVAVPKVYGDAMRFIWMQDLSRVEKGYAGIPEPVDDQPVAMDETALVLMPGLAFDRSGNRMGYGGGFYDRFLAQQPNHPTVALCYDFQLVDEIPVGEYDIPVDRVVCEGV